MTAEEEVLLLREANKDIKRVLLETLNQNGILTDALEFYANYFGSTAREALKKVRKVE